MAEYEIWLMDSEGTTIDVIDEWLGLNYSKAVNEIGALALVLPGNYNTELIRVDGRLAVFRDGGLELETTWLIRRIVKNLDSQGQKIVQVEAVSANELLSRRLVAYNAGTSQADKSAAADDMMKEYVTENLGSGATGSQRDLSTWVSVQGDTTQGPTIRKEAAYEELFSTLQDISQATVTVGSPVYFDIVAPTISTLEFRTYRDVRGIDNSFSAGIAPVVLSTDRGNLANVSRDYDYSDELTYVYAGGQGIGASRVVATASSLDRMGRSIFGRREGWVSAQTSGSDTAVQDEADAGLRRNRPVRKFGGQLVNTPGMKYGVHWNFGDKVTAEHDNESINCVIENVQVSISKGMETIQAQLRVDDE